MKFWRATGHSATTQPCYRFRHLGEHLGAARISSLQYVLYPTVFTAVIFYLPIMAKRMVYKTTTIARAKAAVSKFRSAKKKKASSKTVGKADRAETQS